MFAIWINATLLAAESQQVVWLRCLKMAAGGPAAASEAQLMVTEKVGEALASCASMVAGGSADSVLVGYRRVVRANMERLTS